MSERESHPPGVPCAVTAMQPDLDAAAAFYGGLLGWDFAAGPEDYRVATLRGREVAALAPLAPMLDPPPAAGWVTAVHVTDPDAAAARAREAGGTVLAGPFDLPRGRTAVLQDPTGGVLTAWRPHGTVGAQLVNEPGAWAMSSLQTPDPDAAAAFYGAVFGWTTEVIDFGGVEATMFRLPGYVGGEPEQPVSRETVATMTAGDAPGWTVDFWIDDARAAAARAAALGGAVLAEPFATPVGLTGVLADPAGAVFTISELVLPDGG